MIVYRVEHESIKDQWTGHAIGPFQELSMKTYLGWRDGKVYARAVERLMDHLWSDRDRYPTPYNDPNIGFIDGSQICGVDSIESVHDWFADALPLLEEVGFKIRKYEVPDWACRAGRTGQIVFQYAYANLIEEIQDDRQDA